MMKARVKPSACPRCASRATVLRVMGQWPNGAPFGVVIAGFVAVGLDEHQARLALNRAGYVLHRGNVMRATKVPETSSILDWSVSPTSLGGLGTQPVNGRNGVPAPVKRNGSFDFRACPRCRGDVYREADERTCLNCGWVGYIQASAVVRA